MNDRPTNSAYVVPDLLQLTQNLSEAFRRGSDVFAKLSERPDIAKGDADAQILPMRLVVETLNDVIDFYRQDPNRMMLAQGRLWHGLTLLWQAAWAKAAGQAFAPLITPPSSDRRFRHSQWQENAFYDFIKQAYLLTAKWAQEMVAAAELEPHTALKARFYVEQIFNAFSPTNFPLTNPEVMEATLSSNGANLLRGVEKFAADFNNAAGRWRISQTDGTAFEVGKNIATTPGKVIFRNEIFELIHYTPQTDKVHETPLLISPPWINKFYILDLNSEKSFVNHCLKNGFQTFLISWFNPENAPCSFTFDDYVKTGLHTAMDQVLAVTGAKKLNALGFCVGGTLLATTLGLMAARGDNRVNSATFLTTQVDFEKAGDLLAYVDEEQVKWIEDRMQQDGHLPGFRMADAFNLMRSNDLIWSCMVNNYLLGKDPLPFDLLYWNSDSTSMPPAVHSFYLREFYLHNKLSHGKLMIDGTAIDLSKVKMPIYNLAAKEDHIAPLPSVFRLPNYFAGPTEMVVAGSGHVAGVVNPPALGKYQFWTNEAKGLSQEDWLASATSHTGSWWPHWAEWLKGQSGGMIAPPPIKASLCDAPGTYVRKAK